MEERDGSGDAPVRIDVLARPSRTGGRARPRRVADGAIFLCSLAIACALVMTGTSFLRARAASVPASGPVPLVAVDAVAIERASGHDVVRRFVGRVEPARRVELGFESGGTLDEVLVDEGTDVLAGEPIARLDGRALVAERDRLLADRQVSRSDLDQAVANLERESRLDRDGFAEGRVLEDARREVAQAEAALAAADAAIDAADIALDKAELRAPFAGRVGARFLDEGAIVAAGEPVISLFEATAPVLRVGLPPAVLAALSDGSSHAVDVAGARYAATLASRRPDLAARTRTVDARFAFAPGEPAPSLFGQIATLELVERVPARGHEVPLTALVEGERGTWSLFVVERDADAGQRGDSNAPETLATLRREHVELVHASDGTAFVRGDLPERAEVVPEGVHRVVPGQRVRLAGPGAAVAPPVPRPVAPTDAPPVAPRASAR